MRPTVYVETTVVSYLTAWPSKDVVRAAHQEITRGWWDGQRKHFELFTSQLVLDEARQGDPQAAAERLEVLEQLPPLDVSDAAQRLAVPS